MLCHSGRYVQRQIYTPNSEYFLNLQMLGPEIPKTWQGLAPKPLKFASYPTTKQPFQPSVTEQDIITGCRRQDRKAQRALYERYAPALLGVCRRYMKTDEDAEDTLVEGLFKAMTNMDKYAGTGSFEGWLRRIAVNECLMALRKRRDFMNNMADLSTVQVAEMAPSVVDELSAREIVSLLDKLPTGYRTVFNLYVMEGFKHREIAEELGISINTSKSQLILAKKRLQELMGT